MRQQRSLRREKKKGSSIKAMHQDDFDIILFRAIFDERPFFLKNFSFFTYFKLELITTTMTSFFSHLFFFLLVFRIITMIVVQQIAKFRLLYFIPQLKLCYYCASEFSSHLIYRLSDLISLFLCLLLLILLLLL